jgi:hypothetical protein
MNDQSLPKENGQILNKVLTQTWMVHRVECLLCVLMALLTNQKQSSEGLEREARLE